MESLVPSSIDVPLSSAGAYAMNVPMAFRRERYWFLSFLMTPFKDMDQRAIEQSAPRQPGNTRGR
jgi:hypothetical protein